MKNARTIGFGILAAVACTLALAGGCASDEAATTKEGCSEGAATCTEKTSCCQEKAASECCQKDAAAKQAPAQN